MKLFLPQAQLEEWALDDKADIQDEHLLVRADDARFPVVPAVHFLKLVEGEDSASLVGKVKTQAQLEGLGADHMAESVVLGDTAYEVASGYVATVPTPAGPGGGKPATETELLAAFFLNKV